MTKHEEREWWSDIAKKAIAYIGDVDGVLDRLTNLQAKYFLQLKGEALTKTAINKGVNGEVSPCPEARVLLLLICKQAIWMPKIREAIYIWFVEAGVSPSYLQKLCC